MIKELPQPLSHVQVELLKLYLTGIGDKKLLEIKELIANYLFEKSVTQADKLWEEKGYNDETIAHWLDEN